MAITIKYPEAVMKIAAILKHNGYKAYAVGGCMRDTVMNRVPNDWDITTNASPENMMEIFEKAGIRTIPTGLKHGTVSLLIDREIFECTTFRIDGSYTDSRHPDKVTFTQDISEDLKRRDFTVNAIAGSPIAEDGEIVDLFNGIYDIENKIIRAVGDPEKRFEEDALRILRAVRFATVLDFEIEEKTKAAAIKLRHRLTDISAERKSAEFEKILLSDFADRGIKLLLETDMAKYIHPDIKVPKVNLSSLPKSFATRLASLFDKVPDLLCMKLSGDITKKTKLLCDDLLYGKTASKYSNENANARLMLSKYGDLAQDAALLRENTTLANIIIDEAKKAPCISIKDLAVNGKDLIDAQIPQKSIGKVNSMLLDAVIERPELNNKETLLALAASMRSI